MIVDWCCVRCGLCQALEYKSSIWVNDSGFIVCCDGFPYVVVRVVASGIRASRFFFTTMMTRGSVGDHALINER